MSDKLEKELARFNLKGPRIKILEHAQFDASGKLVREGSSDVMKGEFDEFKYKIDQFSAEGARDEKAGNDILGLGRETRDERLVITAGKVIARAVGSLADGTGYLVDSYGQRINRTQQAPITPMKRSTKDW